MNTPNVRPSLSIAILAIACMVVAACATGTAPPASKGTEASPAGGPTTTPVPSTTPTPPPAAIVGAFDAGGDGWAMTKAGGSLWIQVDAPVDAIVRVDVVTGSATPAVPLGWKPKSGPEGLWVVCCDWLARVDATTGQETKRIPMGGAFALADGAVWLFNDEGLHRIDADTGATGDPIGPNLSTVCKASKDLTIAFESAWVACKEGKVVRVEISSGDVTTISTAPGAHTLAVTDDAVWVTNYQAGSVSRINPETNDVTTISGAGSGVGITTGGGFVWVASPNGIAKIDPTTSAIVEEIDLGRGEYYELVWDDGIIWASTETSRVLKVDPTRD
jgi:hypothetical protein